VVVEVEAKRAGQAEDMEVMKEGVVEEEEEVVDGWGEAWT
jgi:hypothetical protein